MASLGTSDGMTYRHPVQKRDPELGPLEASDSSNHFRDPSMYAESYSSLYLEASPIIPVVGGYNVKTEITSRPTSSLPEGEVCRVCTTRGDARNILTPIFGYETFAERVAWVLELPMFEGDGLPHHLCGDCRATVDSAFEFKTLAWHSDKAFRQASRQQTRDNSTYLEDIAQVNLPGIEDEDRPLEDIARVDVEGEPVEAQADLRIVSCTSLSRAEEELLLSGGLKGTTKRKGCDRGELAPPAKRGRPRKASMAAHKRGRPRKVLAMQLDEIPSDDPSVDPTDSGVDDNAGTLTQKTEEPLTKVADRISGGTEMITAPGGVEEPTELVTTPREKACGATKGKDAPEITKVREKECQARISAVVQTLPLPSCRAEKTAADEEDAFDVDGSGRGHQSDEAPQNNAEDVKVPPTVSTWEQSRLALSKEPQPGPSKEATPGRRKRGRPRREDTPFPYEAPHDDSEDAKVHATTSVSEEPLPGLSEETTPGRRKRGRPRREDTPSPYEAPHDDSVDAKVHATLSEEPLPGPSEEKTAGRFKRGRPRREDTPSPYEAPLDNPEHVKVPSTSMSEEPLPGSPEEPTAGHPKRSRPTREDTPSPSSPATKEESDCDAPPTPPTVASKRWWTCPDCGREYTLKKDLTAHLTNYGGRAQIKCSYCAAVFCNQARFNTHVRTHKGAVVKIEGARKTWTCEDCKREFTLKKDFTSHLTNHGARPTMACPRCKTVFCNRRRYNVHLDSHKFPGARQEEGTAYVCPECGLALLSQAGLEAHAKTTHAGEKLFKCHVCDKPFTFLGSLKDHVKLKHPGEYEHRCDSCQVTFETAAELQEHISTHMGVNLYTCGKCNKKFSIKEVYKSHVKNHDRARPYVCETCGKRFLDKSALRAHQRVHTGDRPYKCNVCDKSYGHANVLRYHQMTHTDERCYGCNICGKSFRNKETLKRHVVAHSNLREFKCNVCGLEFLYKSNLNRHLDNMHGRLSGTKDTVPEDSS